MPRSAVWKSVVSSKGSYGLTLLQESAAGRFAAKSSSFPAGERIFRQNLAAAIPDTFDATETDSIHTGSANGIKKKSKVMRNEEKNKWKQKSSNLPLGIKAKVGLAVKVGAVALGFHVWGIDFIWVVLGFTFCYDILRGIFSCLVSLVALTGFFYFLFTHIF